MEKMATGVAWKMHIHTNTTHMHATGMHTDRHVSCIYLLHELWTCEFQALLLRLSWGKFSL